MEKNLKKSLEVIFEEAREHWRACCELQDFLAEFISKETGMDRDLLINFLSDAMNEDESFDDFFEKAKINSRKKED